jgi:hypothetical protein
MRADQVDLARYDLPRGGSVTVGIVLRWVRAGGKFADYLSLAFWTATAFSPTDVFAVKRWARLMLMMMEAVVSFGIGALVIARAINILK